MFFLLHTLFFNNLPNSHLFIYISQDVLASRKNSGEQEGRVLLNGHPKQEESFSRITSYVEQQDIHMPLTTVREALQFSAAMRLPAGITDAQREAFIDEVCKMRHRANQDYGDLLVSASKTYSISLLLLLFSFRIPSCSQASFPNFSFLSFSLNLPRCSSCSS